MFRDPVNKSADVSVDTRLVLLAAAVAPAHNTNNIVGAIMLTHQRAAGVALQGTERRISYCHDEHCQKEYLNKRSQQSQTWQESTPPPMLPAQNMLSSRESP